MALLVMITCAPTMRAPFGSLSVPAMRPVVGLCATVAAVHSVLSKLARSNAISVFEKLAFGRDNLRREFNNIEDFPPRVFEIAARFERISFALKAE